MVAATAIVASPMSRTGNLHALGHTLLPLIGDRAAMQTIDRNTPRSITATSSPLMRKLGIAAPREGDDELISQLYGLLDANRSDYTCSSASSAVCPPARRARTADAPLLRDSHHRPRSLRRLARRLARTAARRIGSTGSASGAMNAVNPRYVLRNWIAEGASVPPARGGDELQRCTNASNGPSTNSPPANAAAPPPDWAAGLEVSCSS